VSPTCHVLRRTFIGMSDDLRHQLGAAGEQLAAEHLERMGMRVLARNVRTRYGELDIVAADARTLVFCEVKTRRESLAAHPLGGLRRDQQRRIRAMAVAWLSDAPAEARRPDLRFDAIGVVIDGRNRLISIEHLEACF